MLVDSLKTQMGLFPGLEEFIAIIELPDSLFDQMYSSLKSEILKNYESSKFKEAILSAIEGPESVEEMVFGLENLLEEIDAEVMSANKKDLLKTIFGGMRDKIAEITAKPYLPISIAVELCHEDAKIPTYANIGDAGMDIYAVAETIIPAGARVIAKTGLKVAIPFGYELQVRPRSGMSFKTPILIANAPGTIDCGYRDEVGIICFNTGAEDFTIAKGDRIAQFVLQKLPFAEFIVVDSVKDIGTDRQGGFGSTGK